MTHILIVEDDRILNQTLTYNLVSEGYQVDSAYTCREAEKKLESGAYSLLLLDVNLPDGSGFSLCENIRKLFPKLYVIFLTANDRESDMIRGYEAGGMDYVTKPFSVAVLCRKIAAVVKNMGRHEERRDIYQDECLSIDFSGQTATLDGKPLELTPKEYRTLHLFVRNAGILLTKAKMLEQLWDVDGDYVDEHTLTTIISRIRKKIEHGERKYIRTIYGMGYQWIGGGQK